MNLAIDFDALRVALVLAIRKATGLDQNQVIVWEPESAGASLPEQPFFTTQFTRTMRQVVAGWHDAAGNLHVPSSVTASFNCYARTHEQANGLMQTWRQALYGQPTREVLAQANMAMWDMEPMRDLSEQLTTRYQPRAYLSVTFGIDAIVPDPRGEIDAAIVNGTQVGPVGGSG